MSQKYARTPHVPWSAGGTADDEKVVDVAHFVGRRCRISEKLDGENNTLTSTAVFARSHGAPPVHPSNNWGKQVHAGIRDLIDPGLSVFVEYTYALHSIWYRRMAEEKAYLHVIGVRDDNTGIHWSTSDVDLMAAMLGLPTVPVLFEGIIESEEHLRSLMPGTGQDGSAWGGLPIEMVDPEAGSKSRYRVPRLAKGYRADQNIREGEVIRICDSYSDPLPGQPHRALAKAVRPDHVQSDEHWKMNWRPMHEWSPS